MSVDMSLHMHVRTCRKELNFQKKKQRSQTKTEIYKQNKTRTKIVNKYTGFKKQIFLIIIMNKYPVMNDLRTYVRVLLNLCHLIQVVVTKNDVIFQ